MQKTLKQTKKNNNLKKKDSSSDLLYKNLFNSLNSIEKGNLQKRDILEAIKLRGIQLNDKRLSTFVTKLNSFDDNHSINLELFSEIVKHEIRFIERILTDDLIIPNFSNFTTIIHDIFNSTISNKNGNVADYIPQLARVNPDFFALSICTIDGQQYHIGDTNIPYCLQSTCKPINYCIALEDSGENVTHQHVGREPSGRGFNELTLNKDGRPHNPMINAGAIMTSSLIKPYDNVSDRFDHVLSKWQELSGGKKPGFNNAVYLSEKQTADRNFALGYFMKENNAFPENIDLHEILEFYFQCCSIELNCSSHAHVAATLANSGIAPLTTKRVFSAETIKNCLSLMYSCGMYDFSGEFAFSVGLPAKSGVSGSLMLVVPGVCGITIWSPRLDGYGNSVRGVEFAQKLIQKFNFHNYDSLIKNNNKYDPAFRKNELNLSGILSAISASSQGDLNELKSLEARGVDFNESDYDGRTPLHLAASEGHCHVIEYFIAKGVQLNPIDRWNGTPLDDAKRHNHKKIITLLEKHLIKE